MVRYLIDANLPYYFSLWRGDNFLHQKDLGDAWSDPQVWEFARREDMTIVSKDADFSDRAMLEPPPPRVIHIRLGNLKMRHFHQILLTLWPEICDLSARCRLVSVFHDRLEGID